MRVQNALDKSGIDRVTVNPWKGILHWNLPFDIPIDGTYHLLSDP